MICAAVIGDLCAQITRDIFPTGDLCAQITRDIFPTGDLSDLSDLDHDLFYVCNNCTILLYASIRDSAAAGAVCPT